ncbi:MAG: hypothetical protein DRH30_10230, partial [Deltaproteobacteria bacterium]
LTIAHQLAPNTPRYTHHLLYSLVETRRADAAIDLAKDCVRQHATDAEECHLLLYSSYQMTDPELAIRHLLDCMKSDPNSARCSEALTHALTQHPLRARYRELATQH